MKKGRFLMAVWVGRAISSHASTLYGCFMAKFHTQTQTGEDVVIASCWKYGRRHVTWSHVKVWLTHAHRSVLRSPIGKRANKL